MSETDLKINSKVRKILIESNLDISLLSVSSASGAVRIQGKLRKLSTRQMSVQEVAKLLSVLEGIILQTKDVKRVTFSIEEWNKSKGTWRHVKG